MAKNLIMLTYVSFNSCKFILTTVVMLFGFSICLIMNIKDLGLVEDGNPLKLWRIISKGFSKIYIMLTGEFGVDTLNFIDWIGYVVFICFVFAIPINYMNLLNAKAIVDLQTTKKEAMFWYRKIQLWILQEHECLSKNFLFSQVYKSTNIFPELIGNNGFIGIRTTTKEVFRMNGIAEQGIIGKLSENLMKNVIQILRSRKIDD